MLKLLAISVVLLGACKKELPPPRNEFEAFERKFVRQFQLLANGMRARGEKVVDKEIPTKYRPVFVGHSGVYIDRTLVATLADIDSKRAELDAAIAANANILPADGWDGMTATFELGDEPAARAVSALRLFAGRATGFYLAYEDAEFPHIVSHTLCRALTLRDSKAPDAGERPQLSVLMNASAIYVSASKLAEFVEIPDRDGNHNMKSLALTLKDRKASALFAERHDIELGVAGGTSKQVLGAIQTLCNEGFFDIALLPVDQLSAAPVL